jgi:hypothetical protein
VTRLKRTPIEHFVIIFFSVVCVFGLCPPANGHDIITTKLTWNGEISRIVYARCAACHSQGGTSFSLMGYQEARPWAKAIEEEVLERRMPPWGAVKGFGEFRNDQALTQEQLELIANWVEGGAPEGDPNDLPAHPKSSRLPVAGHRAGEITVSGEYRVQLPFRMDGLQPKAVPEKASLQITVEFPDGRIEPIVWLHDYKARFDHPFLLRTPLELPSGSVIHGVPPGSSVVILPSLGKPARRKRDMATGAG